MDSMTVSQVSKNLGVSTRMLRYYEQTGLIESKRREGYAYRVYDEAAVSRLEQILLLRKLRIPVRQIKPILQKDDAVTAIEVFRQNIRELEEEITALSTIRGILTRFTEALGRAAGLPLQAIAAGDDALLSALQTLSIRSINFKEDQAMENLKKADESLSKLSDVRILSVPPATVAAAHFVGDDPETHVNALIDGFVRETALHKKEPGLRRYGFNHPNPVDETGFHGYEAWVTIPPDLEVPAPLQKKSFAGGLYAAHMIAFGSFNEWELLFEWVNQNERYAFAGDFEDQEHMCGLLDEHLNYVSHVDLPNTEPEDMQFDLLMPVREK